MTDATPSAERKSYSPEEKLALVLEFYDRTPGQTARDFAKKKGIQASWLSRQEKQYRLNRHRAFERDLTGVNESLKKQNNRLRVEVSRLKSELARLTAELEKTGRIPLAEVADRSGLDARKFRDCFQRIHPVDDMEGMTFSESEAKAIIDQVYGMVDGFTTAEVGRYFGYDRHKMRRFIGYIEETVQRKTFFYLWRYFFRHRRGRNKRRDHYFPAQTFVEMERLKAEYEKATPTRKRMGKPRSAKPKASSQLGQRFHDDRFID